jgi:hypothetical protein
MILRAKHILQHNRWFHRLVLIITYVETSAHHNLRSLFRQGKCAWYMFWIIFSYSHKSAKMTSLPSVFQQWTSGPNCTTITSVIHVAYPNRKNATDMEGPMMWSSLTMEYEEHLQLLLLKLIWWKEVLHNGTQTFHMTTESLSAIVISYLKRWDLKTIPSDVNVSAIFFFFCDIWTC